MFVLEYNCTKESGFMKELFQNKFLLGVAILFWLSFYLVVALQVKVEAKNQESLKSEISLNLK